MNLNQVGYFIPWLICLLQFHISYLCPGGFNLIRWLMTSETFKQSSALFCEPVFLSRFHSVLWERREDAGIWDRPWQENSHSSKKLLLNVQINFSKTILNTNNLINLQYQTDILSMIKKYCKNLLYAFLKHTHKLSCLDYYTC